MSTLKQLGMADLELNHVAAPVNRVAVPCKVLKNQTAALRSQGLAKFLMVWMLMSELISI